MTVLRRKIPMELALTAGVEGEAFEPAARDETVIVKQDTESPAEIEANFHLTNPNRRIRTRMYGGVTGKVRENLPMSI